MNKLWKILLKGIVAVLPIVLTFYFIYWLVISIEKVFKPILVIILTDEFYIPGLGLITGIIFLFFIGLIVNAWIFKRIIGLGEHLLERIPLVKSVYGALRDFMDYFSPSKEQDELKKVVMVSINNIQLIGFITGEIGELPGINMEDNKVAVYLPMSYQLGGFTVYLSKDKIEVIDISVEDAMRRVLTAGLSISKKSNQK